MAITLAIMRKQRFVFQPQLMRAQQQFGKVDDAGTLARFLVRFVDIDQRARERIGFALKRIRPFAFVLRRVDEPRGLARRESRVVDAEALHHAFDHALLIVGIQNLERLRQFRLAPMLAQQTVRDAVEGADGQATRALADQRIAARAHFAGRLVGEGDGENRPRRRAFHFQQPRDAMREHARLPRAGAREDQVVTDGCADRFALRRIQTVQQMRDIHRRIVMCAHRFRSRHG